MHCILLLHERTVLLNVLSLKSINQSITKVYVACKYV